MENDIYKTPGKLLKRVEGAAVVKAPDRVERVAPVQVQETGLHLDRLRDDDTRVARVARLARVAQPSDGE